jgi:hypothetical protein
VVTIRTICFNIKQLSILIHLILKAFQATLPINNATFTIYKPTAFYNRHRMCSLWETKRITVHNLNAFKPLTALTITMGPRHFTRLGSELLRSQELRFLAADGVLIGPCRPTLGHTPTSTWPVVNTPTCGWGAETIDPPPCSPYSLCNTVLYEQRGSLLYHDLPTTK